MAQLLAEHERAAARAFLQRAEVRLSTMHRIATALLSGAGIIVLLPAVERDSVIDVLRSLLTGDLTSVHAALTIAVAVSIAVPFIALAYVLRDLTQFYFHANHIRHADGESFTPRFTLTSLRLPDDEIGSDATAALDFARRDPEAVALLVPANDSARDRIDRRVAAYTGLAADRPFDSMTDQDRAAALLELAAAHDRTLLEEVAKVEYGMARHVLRTQAIVLRYVKALLALLATAAAAFAAAAVVNGKDTLTAGDDAWLAGLYLLWAPLVVVAVTAPVRWLERQLRNEGATHTAVTVDHELTRVESLTVNFAIGGYLAAVVAMVLLFGTGDLDATGTTLAAVVTGVATAALAAVVLRWRIARVTARG